VKIAVTTREHVVSMLSQFRFEFLTAKSATLLVQENVHFITNGKQQTYREARNLDFLESIEYNKTSTSL